MAIKVMRPTEEVILTPKQENIYQWGWQPEARHRVAVCGRRFGKTFLGMREIRRAAQLAAKWGIHPDNEIWYGAPTFKQAKRTFWQRMKRAIPEHWIAGKPNESECYIQTVTGHMLRIVGLDNYDALRGSGLFFFLGDEWADAKPESWTEVVRPMLSTCNGNSLRIGTPKGFNDLYEIYQRGLSDKVEDFGYKSWHYTSLQGGNIPLSELEDARRDLDAREFQQEYEADFVTYAGRVIYAFSRTKHVRKCDYDPAIPLHIGMDFNVNPMTATVWQERDEVTFRKWAQANGWTDIPAKLSGPVSVQVGEIVIPTSNTDEMADEIARRYGKPNGQNGHITIYPDPAGAQSRTSAQGRTDISILRDPKRGFKVVAMSSHPLVRDRTNVTNARFLNAAGEMRAFIDPACKKSIEALERLVYKEGTSDPEKGEFDHPVDATGYYMFARFGASKAMNIKITGF